MSARASADKRATRSYRVGFYVGLLHLNVHGEIRNAKTVPNTLRKYRSYQQQPHTIRCEHGTGLRECVCCACVPALIDGRCRLSVVVGLVWSDSVWFFVRTLAGRGVCVCVRAHSGHRSGRRRHRDARSRSHSRATPVVDTGEADCVCARRSLGPTRAGVLVVVVVVVVLCVFSIQRIKHSHSNSYSQQKTNQTVCCAAAAARVFQDR